MRCKFPALVATISVAVTLAVLHLMFLQSLQTLPKQNVQRHVEASSTPKPPTAVFMKDRRGISLFKHEVVDGIEKALVFMGYPHSGHSILAAMLDAHQNIVLSTYLLSNWKKFNIKKRVNGDKYELCSEIILSSVKTSPHRQAGKGYTLAIPSQWQGNFSKLKIIGDKSAGRYAQNYSEEWSENAEQTFNDIEQVFKMPMLIIHLVRNPFDMIATHALLQQNKSHLAQHRWDTQVTKLALSVEKLSKIVKFFHNLASGVLAIQTELDSKYRMLEIHHADFVYNPKEILQQICDFLDINCPKDYLQACDSVAFKTLSKSRYLLDWPPEVVKSVNNLTNEFPFFSRYSFDKD